MKKLFILAVILAFAGVAQVEMINNPEGWESNPTMNGWDLWGGGMVEDANGNPIWAEGTWATNNKVVSSGGNPGAYAQVGLAPVVLSYGFSVEFAHGHSANAGQLWWLEADIKDLVPSISGNAGLKLEFYRAGADTDAESLGWPYHPGYLTGSLEVPFAVTTEWAHYSMSATAPANTVFVSAVLFINNSAGGDASGFDNISLTYVNVYTISGTITYGGLPLAGVQMNGLPDNYVTDVNGFYSADVVSGWFGTVTPTKSNYTFTPPNIAYTNVTTNQINQDYIATYEPNGAVEIIGLWGSGLIHTKETGTNRALIFTAHAEDDDSDMNIVSVTYGGQTMTEIIEWNEGTACRAYSGAYILNEAGINAATNANFVVTWAQAPSNAPAFSSIFLRNVDQTNPIGAVAGNGNTTSPIETTALSTNDGDMVIVAGSVDSDGTYTTENGFTKGIELSPESADGVAGYKATTGAVETPRLSHTAVNHQVIIGFVVQYGEVMVNVPDVVGMTEADANSALTAAGLTVGTTTYQYSNTVADGDVIGQNPSAGTLVPPCMAVDLVVSAGQVPIVIMPLGDSITKGLGSTNYNGYRKPLYLDLINRGYNLDFVGSQEDGDFADRDHEGHSGWHAAENGTTNDILDNVYSWLTSSQPEIVMLHIGTNDISQGDEDVNEVNDILDEIDRYEADSNEGITVVLALIINRVPYSVKTTQFNNDVNNMALNRIANGDDIMVVNMEAALNYSTDMADSVHPNDNGYAKMADVWFNALDNFLGIAPTIISTPAIYANIGQLYIYNVDANGCPAPSYALTTYPSGMTIDPNTGLIEWIPPTAGIYDVNVVASNGVGPDDYQCFTITVLSTGPPEISGHVNEPNGTPIEGVLVLADNNGGSDTTDSNGFYKLGIPLNWTGNVIPTKTGCMLNPYKRTYSQVITSWLNQNYEDIVAYDVYADGSIDWNDVMIISQNWLDTSGENICDFNEDGKVNLEDYTMFASVWLY